MTNKVVDTTFSSKAFYPGPVSVYEFIPASEGRYQFYIRLTGITGSADYTANLRLNAGDAQSDDPVVPKTTYTASGEPIFWFESLIGWIAAGDSINVMIKSTAATDTACGGTVRIWKDADLEPTVPGRTADVSLGGEVGIDWANIGTPTGTVNLSGTTIKDVTDVETVLLAIKGGSWTIESLKAIYDQVMLRLLTSGYSAPPSAPAIADAIFEESSLGHTGTLAANLDIAVSSRLASASYIAPPSAASIADAVFDEESIGHTGTIPTNLDSLVSSRLPTASYVPPPSVGTIADALFEESAIGHTGTLATNLDATVSSRLPTASYVPPPSVGAIADAVFDENSVGHTGTIPTNLDTTISSRLSTGSYVSPPSAGTIADAVFEESAVSHTGTLAMNLDATVSSRLPTASYVAPPSSSSIADAVFDESGVGHAGLIPTNLDVPVSTVGGGGGGASAASIWSYASRTLTQGAKTIQQVVAGGPITQYRDSAIYFSLTGLGSLVGRTKLYFTVKQNANDPDSQAVFQLEETAGLLYANGGLATAANGSLTVTNQATGSITIKIKASVAAGMPIGDNFIYDLKKIQVADPDVYPVTQGTFVMEATATKAIS